MHFEVADAALVAVAPLPSGQRCVTAGFQNNAPGRTDKAAGVRPVEVPAADRARRMRASGEEEVPRHRAARQTCSASPDWDASARGRGPRARVRHAPGRPRPVHLEGHRLGTWRGADDADEVCATADYLTLHLPSTAETKHLLLRHRLRPGAGIRNAVNFLPIRSRYVAALRDASGRRTRRLRHVALRGGAAQPRAAGVFVRPSSTRARGIDIAPTRARAASLHEVRPTAIQWKEYRACSGPRRRRAARRHHADHCHQIVWNRSISAATA